MLGASNEGQARDSVHRAHAEYVWRRGNLSHAARDAHPSEPTVLEAGIAPVWEVLPRFGSADEMPGVEPARRRDAAFRRSLAVTDVLSAYAALAFALWIVPGAGVGLRAGAVLIAPFVVAVAKALGIYDRDPHRLRKTTVDEIPQLIHLALFYTLAVWLLQVLIVGGRLERDQVVALLVASLGFATLFRALTRVLVLRLTSPERCLLVGGPADVRRTAEQLARAPGIKARLVGSIAITDDGRELPSLTDSRSFTRVIEGNRVERVIIVPDGREQDDILQCVRLVKALGVKVSVVPRLLEVVGTSSVFDEIGGATLLGVRPYGLTKSSAILKRMMDVTVASAAVVLLAPLMAMLAVAIKLDSPGPALFRQLRIGRHGQRFWMLKFRSMVDGADHMKDDVRDLNEARGGLFKIGDDPRVTRVGRFLRRASLDELPQLLNVLHGDMSLVGPRPLVSDEDILIEGWERRRLVVRPGITGLWQIFGPARIPLDEMVKLDYLYGANWSIWMDLKILIRTVPYVLGRRGM